MPLRLFHYTQCPDSPRLLLTTDAPHPSVTLPLAPALFRDVRTLTASEWDAALLAIDQVLRDAVAASQASQPFLVRSLGILLEDQIRADVLNAPPEDA
jgi:hypothetical protein